ncbi:MAG: biotin--[acetyl-CoA-carboxylase] ligase [Coprothermobacterota bacterium]|nr:biotin--[acetyl-CoA-carboxylase] ligase [Coprothermobacterota bacterium]
MMTSWPVIRLEEADSTMEAARLETNRRPPPFVILAERQTHGRGWKGNEWISPAGGLWWTAVFPVQQAAALSLFLSLPMLRVLSRYSPHLAAKWPNDLYTKERKKVGGILVEVRSGIAYAGVGINVNNCLPPELAGQAISLSKLVGHPLDLDVLLGELLDALAEDLPRFNREGFTPFRALYEERLLGRDKRVTLQTDAETLEGRISGIREDGCLLLETETCLRVIALGSLTRF